VPKTFTDDEAEYITQSATYHWLSIDCWTCELRSDKNSYWRPCSVDRTVGDAPANVCLWRPVAWTNTPKEENRKFYCTQWYYLKPKQLIIKDCAGRFVLKLYRHEASRGLCATAELLVETVQRSRTHRGTDFHELSSYIGEIYVSCS